MPDVSFTELVELDTVKRALGIDDEDTSQDDDLTRQIQAVSDVIEGLLCRTLRQQDYEEITQGNGTQWLQLSQYPVSAVDSVVVDGSEIDDEEYRLIKRRGQLFCRTGWSASCYPYADLTGDSDRSTRDFNITVTYTAGYVLPGAEGRDLPPSLEEACLRAVRYWQAAAPGVTSEHTPGGYSYTVSDIQKYVRTDLWGLIGRYKKADRSPGVAVPVED